MEHTEYLKRVLGLLLNIDTLTCSFQYRKYLSMTIIQLLKSILFPECTELEAMNIQLRIDNNMLRNNLDAFIQIPQQTSTKRIDKIGLKKVLTETFGDTWIGVFDQSDNDYKLVDKEYFKSFLESNTINNLKYIPTQRDCDDFSDMLMGDVTRFDSDLAVGTVWVITETGCAHALNWMITTDEQIMLIEPQDDTIFPMPSNWSLGNHLKM